MWCLMVYNKRLKPFYHIFLLKEKWGLSSSAFNKKLCLGTSAWLNTISLWPQACTSQQLWDGIYLYLVTALTIGNSFEVTKINFH